MSGAQFLAGAETALAGAVLGVLRADAGVQGQLGLPARVFDDETRGAMFPFVQLERHDVRPGDAVSPVRLEHQLQFAAASRDGGRLEAKAVLGALRAAVEGADWQAVSPPGQRIVLAMVTYSDAMRTRDRSAYRGILRVRVIVEVSDATG